MLDREIAQYTCLLGTLVQEVHATHPDLRAVCDREMSAHVADLVQDLEAAKAQIAGTARSMGIKVAP